MSTNKPINESTDKLTIGLFGFGVVGKGLYDVLHSTPTLRSSIKDLHKNPEKNAASRREHFTTDASALLNDESINVIVELIDDADAAYRIVKTALQKAKAVVSITKKMIAEHFEELLALQQRHKTAFLYEAACCASMPIVRNLEEYYDNDLLKSIRGIINGSTNYILHPDPGRPTGIQRALSLAQQLGFAESNPKLDIGASTRSTNLASCWPIPFGVIANRAPLSSRYRKHRFIPYGHGKSNTASNWWPNAKKLNNGKLCSLCTPQFVTAKDGSYTR